MDDATVTVNNSAARYDDTNAAQMLKFEDVNYKGATPELLRGPLAALADADLEIKTAAQDRAADPRCCHVLSTATSSQPSGRTSRRTKGPTGAASNGPPLASPPWSARRCSRLPARTQQSGAFGAINTQNPGTTDEHTKAAFFQYCFKLDDDPGEPRRPANSAARRRAAPTLFPRYPAASPRPSPPPTPPSSSPSRRRGGARRHARARATSLPAIGVPPTRAPRLTSAPPARVARSRHGEVRLLVLRLRQRQNSDGAGVRVRARRRSANWTKTGTARTPSVQVGRHARQLRERCGGPQREYADTGCKSYHKDGSSITGTPGCTTVMR